MDLHSTAKLWAEKETASEAEAFETAIKRLKPFEVDDVQEQAWREAYTTGYKAAMQKMCAENAELRDEIKIQAEQIQRLRECIARSNEEFYD